VALYVVCRMSYVVCHRGMAMSHSGIAVLLDVAVHDVLGVDVVQCLEQLVREVLHMLLLELLGGADDLREVCVHNLCIECMHRMWR
jgi:hypothetical protein